MSSSEGAIPEVPPEKAAIYRKKFEQCQQGGVILGSQAPTIFAPFKLTRDKLFQIWSRVDPNRTGKLDVAAFIQACHLATLAAQAQAATGGQQAQAPPPPSSPQASQTEETEEKGGDKEAPQRVASPRTITKTNDATSNNPEKAAALSRLQAAKAAAKTGPGGKVVLPVSVEVKADTTPRAGADSASSPSSPTREQEAKTPNATGTIQLPAASPSSSSTLTTPQSESAKSSPKLTPQAGQTGQPSPRLGPQGAPNWTLTRGDLANYKVEFDKIAKNGFVPTVDIPKMFAPFGLELAVCRKIWFMCDRNKEKGKGLGPLEYIAAIHILNGVKRGWPVPETLPNELTATQIFAVRNQKPVDLPKEMLALQKRFRGKLGRIRARVVVLWHTLKELERQEENKLTDEQKYYLTLRERYAQHVGKGMMSDVGRIPNILERLKARISRIAVSLEERSARCDKRNGVEESGLISLKPDTPITLSFIKEMVAAFQKGFSLSYESAWQILQRVCFVFAEQKNVVDLRFPDTAKLNVVGDIHGQLDDFLTVLQGAGFPNENNYILFNGDFVDRGANSCECVLSMFALKLLYPNYVYLNRGNHEAADINALNGFEKEVLEKYDRDLFDLFSDTFACLPLAHIVKDKIFVVHAGLASVDFGVQDIFKLNRFLVNLPLGSLISDILWSDPTDKPGRSESKRGTGVQFGPDVCQNFLKTNNLSMIIRSHECVDGTEDWFQGKLMTVFSASNYCGDTGNIAAYLVLDASLKITPKTYQAEKMCTQRALDAKQEEKKKPEQAAKERLEKNVIQKLKDLITTNSTALLKYYTKIAGDRSYISRVQWADGLRLVIGVGAPFLYFSKEIGLQAGRGEPVDFLAFLSKFDATVGTETTRITNPAHFMLFLRKQTKQLEALFRSFDDDKKGSVPMAAFQTAVIDLIRINGIEFDENVVRDACVSLDTNGNGDIEYHELSLRGMRRRTMLTSPQTRAAGLDSIAKKYGH